MANPVQPVGGNDNDNDNDIYESARQQDAERRAREAQAHFERTGESVREYQEHSPLVPINGHSDPQDIADDGDAYDNIGGFNRNTNADESLAKSQSQRQREDIVRYRQRKEEEEVIKKKEEYKILKEASKKKFRNAISGLEIDDEE